MKNLKSKNSIWFSVSIITLSVLIFSVLVMRLSVPKGYYNEISYYSKRYNVSAALVFAVIRVESNFTEDASSKKGARGLMQITDKTFDYVKELEGVTDTLNIYNRSDNIMIGTRYLSYLMKKFESEYLAVCAYNAGEGNVLGWLNDPQLSEDGKTLKSIPFKETAAYVKKVAYFKKLYAKLYKL